MVIEVKNTLGAGDSVTKSITQLLEAKEDLEAWFATEGLENWTYRPMIYAEKIEIDINCSECKRFVIIGMNYFQQYSIFRCKMAFFNILNPNKAGLDL